MGQAQYWMWTKKQFLKSHFQVSMNSLSESWEEKAFAEDAARSLGGCIWPPRSYSCSFCRKDFKSAQALGGHMNVHRRDRARLKQSLSTPENEVVPYQNHNPNPLKSSDPRFPHKAACTLDSNDDCDRSSTTTFSASRVSALSARENFSPCSIVQEQCKERLFGSDSTAERTLNDVVSGSKPEAEKRIKLVGEDSVCLGSDDDDDHVETNLSVGLNSVFIQNRPTVTCGEEAINFKRPRIDAVSTLPLLVSNEKYCAQEDLDLELRLGVDQPKVK
ncbi:hypothetical protein PTKIN_Ptkin13bG0175100 [Pterospermum kingtungense]